MKTQRWVAVRKGIWGGVCVVGLVCLLGGGENTTQPADPAGLAQLKSLAGTWEGTATHGDEPGPAKVSYRVTAGGTTVIETMFEGTENEMVTVYHMDGDKLLLTHYCMVGNQPTMVADDAGATDELHFVCTGDGHRNMVSEDDGHMHDVVMRFVSDDHLQSQWQMQAQGENGPCAKIDLHRVR